ncbi:MAG: BTAD domain-containing putative transcriptional regulator [Nitrospirota bacterium]
MIKQYAPITKIARPSAAGIFPRERLFLLLDRERKHAVIHISSPSGAGKTALLTSYVEVRKTPCLWYQIDERDSDIATFFYYMGMAAKKVCRKKRMSLPLLGPEYSKGILAFSRHYFENLFSHFRPPFVLVLDNYQNVSSSSNLHDMIVEGLEMIPEGINVFLLSRKSLPPSFARLRANDRIYSIAWDDIRLSLEESKKLADIKGKKNLSDEIMSQLHWKCEGWAAGVVLMLHSIKSDNVEPNLFEKIPQREIFDYFASEVLDKENTDTRLFLLKTAFLPKMTAQTAERLTGMKISRQMLSGLSMNHCFINVYLQTEPVYQYHSLFKEFLLSRAKDTFSRGEIEAIQRLSAQLLEESEQMEDAADLYKKSLDFNGLARIVRKFGQSLVDQGRHQTLREWIDIIPKEIFPQNAWLLYRKGTCYLPFDPAKSCTFFEEAFKRFSSDKDVSGCFLAWSGVVESIIYGSEGLKPVDRWGSLLDGMIKEYKGFPSDYIESTVTCSMLKAISLRGSSFTNTEEWVKRARAMIQRSLDISIRIKLLTNLACCLYNRGTLKRLGVVIDSLSELVNHPEMPVLTRLIVSWLKAAYLNIMSLHDDCQRVISEGLEFADKSGLHIMDYMLMGHGALSFLKEGDFATARKFLKKMAALSGFAKQWEVSFYHYILTWESLLLGNRAQAFSHSEECLNMCESVGNPWTLFLVYLQRAFLFHEFGHNEEIMKNLNKARQIGTESKNEFSDFACSFAQAYFLIKWQEEESAVAEIQKAFRIGRDKGFFSIYMCMPEVMQTIATKAIDRGIEVDYVKELIKRNAILPIASFLDLESWPWPLKVRTLGGFELIGDGSKPVRFSGKVQKMPLMMLKVLIALGGKEVREEQLTDILWPEAEGDAAHSAFATNLSRLRQLLGREKVLRFQDGKASIDPRYCWVDAWAFERICDYVDTLRKKGDSKYLLEQIMILTEKAMNIYKGPFLISDAEHSWTISYRERLRTKFLRLIVRTGECIEEARQCKRAIEYYERAIEVDDLVEEFYQRLMACYHELGQRARAIDVYRRCRETIQAVFGIDLSPKTEAIYKSILQSQR